MFDLIVTAFKLDLTRVATLVVDPERWTRRAPIMAYSTRRKIITV